MIALAEQSSAFDTSAGKHPAVGRRHLPAPISLVSTMHGGETLLQRKANCACGGGCPSCFEEAHTRNIQTKLQVNTPGDDYEQEADRVAERVMRAPALSHARVAEVKEGVGLNVSGGSLQGSSHSHDVSVLVNQALRSSGEPLDESTRLFMESQFGHDFAPVRVHANGHSAESASSLSARAYTVGEQIVFGAGEYQPSSSVGRQLIAHELAHVVQQRSGGPLPLERVQRSPDPTGGPASGAEASAPKKIKFWINSFIPDSISGAKEITKGKYKGKTMFRGPFQVSDCFLSDSRGFSNDIKASSRLHLEAEADLSSRLWSFPTPTSSGTAELDCEDMEVECEQVANPTASQFPATDANIDMKPFSFSATASDPCVTGAPAIDVNGKVTIDTRRRIISFIGMIEPFPAFEAYVSVDGGIPLNLFTSAIQSDSSAWSLFGDATIQVIAVTTY
jgi:hypothetical protein